MPENQQQPTAAHEASTDEASTVVAVLDQDGTLHYSSRGSAFVTRGLADGSLRLAEPGEHPADVAALDSALALPTAAAVSDSSQGPALPTPAASTPPRASGTANRSGDSSGTGDAVVS